MPTGFRARGHEITRVEGFTDAVFAFAVTLLVVSLEVPKTYGELMSAIYGFPAFAACFAILFSFWYAHHVFFRRYALQDPVTIALSGVLLFVVLFYVYPLKFLFTRFFAGLLGTGLGTVEGTPMSRGEAGGLFVIYGLGYLAVELVFICLYRHALAKRAALQLSPVEEYDTRSSVGHHSLHAAVAILSCLIAVAPVLPPAAAGFSYFLLGPLIGWHATQRGRARRRLIAQAA